MREIVGYIRAIANSTVDSVEFGTREEQYRCKVRRSKLGVYQSINCAFRESCIDSKL